MADTESGIRFIDLARHDDTFEADVVEGLRRSPKEIPSMYFYDRRGSELFEEICELDEYYVTRTEMGIMRRYAKEMSAAIGPNCLLIEYGSGVSEKTRILLDHLESPAGYIPIDISRGHLREAAESLEEAYPELNVTAVCADFNETIALPAREKNERRRVAYFPGSTIGNLEPGVADAFLRRVVRLCGTGGGLLIGVDLQKSPDVLVAAYSDANGVTAEFNYNLLTRINRELDGDFDLDNFQHRAVYDAAAGRMESRLVSRCDQTVTIGKETFDFDKGEYIRTEYSHKYTLDGFRAIAERTGFDVSRVWMDDKKLFSVQLLIVK